MGNLQKITKTQAKAVIREIERYPDITGNIPHFNHEVHEIDYSKTYQNYAFDLSQTRRTGIENLEKRLSEVKVLNRDDVKVIGSWVWQTPKDLPAEYEKDFFKAVISFYIQKHGKDNIAYAVVHKDERTPHIHIGIIPVAKNSKGIDRISAKDVFNKAYLNTAHYELQEYVSAKLGMKINLLTGETLGVDGIKNYKKVKDLNESIEQLEEVKNILKQEIKQLNNEKTKLKHEIASLHDETDIIGFHIQSKEKELTKVKEEVDEYKSKLQEFRDFFSEWPNYFFTVAKWISKKLGYAFEKLNKAELESEFKKDIDTLNELTIEHRSIYSHDEPSVSKEKSKNHPSGHDEI